MIGQALVLIAAVGVPATHARAEDQAVPLFDGSTLQGWEVPQADAAWWRAEEGCLRGGSLTESVPHNIFLATREEFENFDLRLQIRIQGTEGFINSGIQIRSQRVPDSSEMSGYQVDAGAGWWGKLYDESRRNRVIAEAANLPAVQQAVRTDDWNDVRIRADGQRIQSWINGVPALDFTETDSQIPQRGHLGVQVHGGGKALVEVRNISLQRLPDSPAVSKSPDAVRTPEEERQGFHVPPGFEVELVAAESEGIGKFVSLAFDAAGRLWTMTALEYPLDGNENPQRAEQLYAAGGKDKVLVYENPYEKQPGKPRVFADGLVIPLGILPEKDGVLVQYGHEIRRYRDRDSDGRADDHEVVLQGFGVQDSHLFPHQFTRVPGGWVWLAQGAFNFSQVQRPDGLPFADGSREVPFNQCKLARFRPDGSAFEALTAGPYNIWGITISREGEAWLQEANDIGCPLIPYEPGGRYVVGPGQLLRPYQPMLPPPLGRPQMGGTGLSGLALADDRDGWPAPWGARGADELTPRSFYLANPITSRIQRITAVPQPDGHFQYEKQDDFLLSDDPLFRPVAMQFGPDGCLYIVDWYNKIISHNEVPRDHPERDKTHGRIWRIRHAQQPSSPPVNLTTIPVTELLDWLGADNARIADLAWQTIISRQAVELIPQLQGIVMNSQLPAARRLGAVWALEGLQSVPQTLLLTLATDTHPQLRHEAVRIAGAQATSEADFVAVAGVLKNDSDHRVRAALGDALRHVDFAGPATLALMMSLGQASMNGEPLAAYDREFERYLARWAMERHPQELAAFLASSAGQQFPLENRVLATLALEEGAAARGLAELAGRLSRPLTAEELRLLVLHMDDPAVAGVFQRELRNPAARLRTLQSLMAIRTQLNTAAIQAEVEAALAALWSENPSPEQRQLLIEAAGAFRAQTLAAPLTAFAVSTDSPRDLRLRALQALREIGPEEIASLAEIVRQQPADPQLRQAALAVLCGSAHPASLQLALQLFPTLDFSERPACLEQLASHRAGAAELLTAIEQDELDEQELSVNAVESMRTLLPGNVEVDRLWQRYAGRVQRVLRLTGSNNDYLDPPITLDGPFTVEAWVRLAPGIDNRDGLLGRNGVADFNFYGEAFRVWVAERGDVVISPTRTQPNVWTHYAVTRDPQGMVRIYLNGELAATSAQPCLTPLTGLQFGRTTPAGGGTEGQFTELRVWNHTRTADEIRRTFDLSMAVSAPAGLVMNYAGDQWPGLHGQARLEPVADGPRLLKPEEFAAQTARFDRFRELAMQPGDIDRGRVLFQNKCQVCHSLSGTGGKIGPHLDGVGLTGTEALLRNLLTPSAAMEAGYVNFRILTRDGRILQGLLVSQDAEALVLRMPNTSDLRVPRHEIEQATFTGTSIMPEGLLESLPPDQVSDLFTYLLSLRQGSPPMTR